MLTTMTHPEASRPSAEDLLTLKANIRRDWDRLPPEHQASMALVLVEQVTTGEMGKWFMGALKLLNKAPEPNPQFLPFEPMLQAHLQLAGLSEAEREQLTAEDLHLISARVMEHLTRDVLMDELEYAARRRLEEKQSNAPDLPEK